ncbi:MAG TPA: MGMT family protein [Ruminococcus sp.]|nr:MGMT family protein [Ruminococcus sp.]
MNNIYHYTSPLGGITLSSDSETLTGYAGGLDKKTALLKLEKYEI